MDQLDQRGQQVTSTPAARAGCLVVAAVVLAAGGLVVGLRIANPDAEPEGQNWWLVSLFVASVAFGIVGASLAALPGRRLLGASFVVVGIAAALTAVSTQYAGYLAVRGGDASWAWVADIRLWSFPLGAGVLVAVVPWLLAAASGRWLFPVVAGSGLAVATSAIAAATSWPAWVGELARWLVAVAATAGTLRRRGAVATDASALAGSVAGVDPRRVGRGLARHRPRGRRDRRVDAGRQGRRLCRPADGHRPAAGGRRRRRRHPGPRRALPRRVQPRPRVGRAGERHRRRLHRSSWPDSARWSAGAARRGCSSSRPG